MKNFRAPLKFRAQGKGPESPCYSQDLQSSLSTIHVTSRTQSLVPRIVCQNIFTFSASYLSKTNVTPTVYYKRYFRLKKNRCIS